VTKKIIILTSTQNSEKHLLAWQKTIEQLEPKPAKVIFCENDSTDGTHNIVKSWTFPHELISFKSTPKDLEKDLYAVIAKNRQLLLDRVREIDPDFAVFLDDDVFPQQTNVLKRLTDRSLDMVGGTYFRYYKDPVPYIAAQWKTDSPLFQMPQIPNLENKVADAIKRGVPFLLFTWIDQKLYKVTVTSAGCLCLSRKVLQDENLNFYPKGKIKGYKKILSEDFEFCLLARKLGYEVHLDGRIRLDHLAPTPDKKRPWITVAYKLRYLR
jgi:GT2 family glycosyltransferase